MEFNVGDDLLSEACGRGGFEAPALPVVFPFDADAFERFCADGRRYRIGPPPAEASAHDETWSVPTEPIELTIYVSADSVACAKALASLRAVVALFPSDRVRFEVRDVANHVEAAARDRILFTPTLLCAAGMTTVRVLGDLSNQSVLMDLLRTAGLQEL